MKTFTKDEQIENLLVAKAMMMDVDERAVNLETFSNERMELDGPHACGACACFGGYVAIHPYFKKLGVCSWQGIPQMRAGSVIKYSTATAEALFGNETMFSGRRNRRVSQKQEVLDRIDAQLEVLLS